MQLLFAESNAEGVEECRDRRLQLLGVSLFVVVFGDINIVSTKSRNAEWVNFFVTETVELHDCSFTFKDYFLCISLDAWGRGDLHVCCCLVHPRLCGLLLNELLLDSFHRGVIYSRCW